MTTVSIIVPVYNCETYISKCLAALSAQTFQDIEIICIDDGSTDYSADVIRRMAEKDGRIKLLSQKNAGPGAARQTGLACAEGKYIQFCDADDLFLPQMCEKMVQAMESGADIASCNVTVKDENNCSRNKKEISYYANKFSGLQDITYNVLNRTTCVLWNKIFKKEIIDRFKVKFPPIFEGEDESFYQQYMLAAQRIFFIEDTLYVYLRREDSIMGVINRFKSRYLLDGAERSRVLYRFLTTNSLWEKHRDTYFKLLAANFLTTVTKTAIKDIPVMFNAFCELEKELNLTALANPEDVIACRLTESLRKRRYFKSYLYCSSNSSIKFKLFGISLYKIKVTGKHIKFFLLGVPLWRLKI